MNNPDRAFEYMFKEHSYPLNNIMHRASLKAEAQYHKDIETAFRKGAVDFVKHEITNEINALGANAFYRFSEMVKAMGDVDVIPFNADLCDSVENTKAQREWLNTLFEMTFGEGEHARP